MTLEEKIQEFITFRRGVCDYMLQGDRSSTNKLYVSAQESLLSALEELLKE
jgi:hypothetical protein